MTAPKPSTRARSEEELLEQWEFLDRLVERQANLLRSGVQDTEEVDDPVGDQPGLEHQLETLRAQLAAAEEGRAAAERRVAELDHRLRAAVAELEQARVARSDALTALHSAHLEVQGLRERLERRRRILWPLWRR